MSATARSGDAALHVLAARSVALYALSLHAAASALLAWTAVEPRQLLVCAAGLALALVLGESFGGMVDASLEATSRLRLRVTVAAAYGGFVVLALSVAVGTAEARLIGQEALFFTFLQAAFLLAADLGRTYLGPVANALALVVLASLGGGVVAAEAVIGGLALLGFFLALDHAARVLRAYPASRANLLGATLGRAAAALAPIVVGLTIFFALAPSAPLPGLSLPVTAPPPTKNEEMAAAFRQLVALALIGGGLVFGVARFLRRDRGARSPLEEALPLERGAEEALPEPPPRARREYRGRRGRIVRAYVNMLARARDTGFILRPSQTARDIALELKAPAATLGPLTELFVGARYGPEEPSEEQAGAAERAGRAVTADLGKRTGV